MNALAPLTARMKPLFVAVFFVVSPLLLSAQTPDTAKTVRYRQPVRKPTAILPADELILLNQLNSLNNNGNTNTQIRLVDNRYEGLRGTPYLVPAWSKGEIELTTGKVYASVPMKFDASNQNLVVLRPPANDSIIVYANQIKRFAFQDTEGNTFLYRRYPDLKTDNAALKNGYFQVLYAGKNTLLKQVTKTIRRADYRQPYSPGVAYDSYQEDVAYYLLRPDNTLAKVKRSRKSLLDTVGGDQGALKAFADREKLSFKTDDDMAKLIKFADGM